MDDSITNDTPISDRSGVTDGVRVQILAAEHWGLLATRSMTWNEIFTRASMFLTLLSAVVVALALVAQAMGFDSRFRLFALLLLPVVLVLGVATFIHLGEANGDDVGLVLGMHRLRSAYLELAPELQPYFSSGFHDDDPDTFGSLRPPGFRMILVRILGGTPMIVATINVVVVGVIAALIANSLGASDAVGAAIGVLAALAAAVAHAAAIFKSISRFRRALRPPFQDRDHGV